MVEEILSLLWALFVTCLVLVLAYFFTKYLAGHMAASRPLRGRRLAVLEQTPVGKDQKLLLVRLDDRLYFLAMTQGGTTILRELTEEESAAWQAQQTSEPVQPGSFAQALHRVLEQRKK